MRAINQSRPQLIIANAKKLSLKYVGKNEKRMQKNVCAYDIFGCVQKRLSLCGKICVA